MKQLSVILLLLAGLYGQLPAQSYIGNIYIDRRDVFDSTQKDWFFAARLANSLHTLTKSYLIEDELLFGSGDIIDEDLLEETERNLRSMGLFSNVRIEVDSAGDDKYDIFVVTQDKWSTSPNLLFGTGGRSTNYGMRMKEENLIGTGTYLSVEGLYRTENGIGWQGIGELKQRRLFRSEYSLAARLLAHKYRTEQSLDLQKPFRTLNTEYSYGINFINNYGDDFLYASHDDKNLMPFHERRIKGWFSRGWKRSDRVFFTSMIEMEDVNRGKPEYKRAYDNSGKILLAFSSVSEDYYKINCINYYAVEDMPIGGWGTAVLGKTFAVGSKGESMYYVGAQGEKSWLLGNLYLFAQLAGATSFSSSLSKYTYEEFMGLGFYRLTDRIVAAARVRQQTVWRWNRLRQLILDNETGLRGYSVNDLQGDNRFVANIEMRFFPDIDVWIARLGGVLFFDTGTAWPQKVDLLKTRWHSSVGFGFRVENMKADGPNALFRIDFAFNLDQKRFAEIIFTTDQLFSAFQGHGFRLPEIYGLDFDYE